MRQKRNIFYSLSIRLFFVAVVFGVHHVSFAQIERGGLLLDETATRLNPKGGAGIYNVALHNLSFDKEGKRLVAGQGTGQVYVWDVERFELVNSFKAHQDWAFSLAFSQDGKRLISGGGDNLVKIWSLDDLAKPVQIFERHTGDVHSVHLNSDESELISAGDDMVPVIHDLSEGTQKADESKYRVLNKHPRQIPAMALSKNDQILATAARDGKIRLFDYESGDLLFTLDAHEKDCITLRIIPGSNQLVSGGYDGTVAVWNTSMGYLVNRFDKLDGAIVCVDASPDGTQVVAVNHHSINLYSTEDPKAKSESLKPEIASDEQLSFVRFHPSGKTLFVTTTLGRILVVDKKTLKVSRVLTTPDLTTPQATPPAPKREEKSDK